MEDRPEKSSGGGPCQFTVARTSCAAVTYTRADSLHLCLSVKSAPLIYLLRGMGVMRGDPRQVVTDMLLALKF